MAAADTRHQFDVEHYCALVSEERGLVEEILTLADELRLVTIERLLAKSDLEVVPNGAAGNRAD